MAIHSELFSHLQRSTFTFAGTVQEVGASTMAHLHDARDSLIVRVDEVHHAPPSLTHSVGALVTVHGHAAKLAAQQKAVFFTTPTLYADTLLLREVATLSVPEDLSAFRAQMTEAKDRLQDLRILERIRSAELIVRGTVSGLSAAGQPTGSEHDPDWWVAKIRVLETLLGKATEAVELVFPNSRDVQWYKSPKPHAGEHGVWILRHVKIVNGLTALDPLDAHPAEHVFLEHFRRLIREARG